MITQNERKIIKILALKYIKSFTDKNFKLRISRNKIHVKFEKKLKNIPPELPVSLKGFSIIYV